MSASSGVNVLRYTALAVGVFYGFSHQRTITATQKAAAAQREFDHKQSLINQAKAEYAKLNAPPTPSSTSTGVVQDPMDPKFDLEAYFNQLAKQNP